MTTSESPGGSEPQRIERVDLQRKVSLKFKELQGFITEYSENLSVGGMFIRTMTPPPPGTVFDFEFTLGEDYRLIHGIGEVVWVRPKDEGFDQPAGMGVRFLRLDPESQALIDRIVSERLEREGRTGDAPPEVVPGEPWVERVLGQPERHPEAAAASPAGPRAGPEQLSLGGGEARPGALGELPEAPPSAPSPSAGSQDWGLETGPLDPPEPSASAASAWEQPIATEPATPVFVPPSPVATSPYARSYQGAAVAGTPKGHRSLVAVVLAVLVVVAAAAVMVLFFPELSVRWLVGEGTSKAAPERVAERPSAPPGGVEQPVAPPAATPTTEPDVEPPPVAEPAPASRTRTSAPSPEPAPVPKPAAAPPPAPRPAPASSRPAARAGNAASPAAGATFSKVLNIISEPQGDELAVTIFLDGRVEEWQYSVARLQSPPRELVRIQGIHQPFPRSELPVSNALARRIRVGFHPEKPKSELHVVVDLAGPGVALERSEAAGKEIRLYFSKSDG